MPVPGPPELGRSVVVTADTAVPTAWTASKRVRIDDTLLDDRAALGDAVTDLHHAWVARTPMVIELAVPPARLSVTETTTVPPWELGGEFTFPLERLRFLVWVNSYNALDGDPTWRWADEAIALGAVAGTETDVVLPDGTPAWIDGGPRGATPTLDSRTVHFETVAMRSLSVVPDPGGDTDPHLAPDQLDAVTHERGSARVIAPAGSGKTRTLTARLRHLLASGVEPDLICAVAYNTRAAAEMTERMGADAPLRIRTIHSLGRSILLEARGTINQLEERDVRSRLDRMVVVARRPNTDTLGPYIEALSEIRIALRAPELVELERDDVPDLATIHRRYRSELEQRGEADFDELIFGAIEALLADASLRKRWQSRCRHLLVDEFQDLTPAYLLLLRLVASPGLDVFGVGDDDQVIYGYAGADPRYLIDYEQLFPGASPHALETNYRCPSPVVDAAATLLTHNRRRIDKTMHAGPDAVTDPAALVVSQEPGSELAVHAADLVGTWLDDGIDAGAMVVLCRVNSALLPVHAALADAGRPFVSPLDEGVLRRTVSAATLAWMRLGLMPDDLSRADVLAAITRPSRGLNRIARQLLTARRYSSLEQLRGVGDVLDGKQAKRWAEFCDSLTDVIRAAAGGDATRILDTIIDGVGLAGSASLFDGKRSRADRSSHSDDLSALRRAAAIHPDANTFEEWLRRALATPSTPGGVLLTTVHRVKGLEWDRVIVFGADRSLMPHALSSDVEEERRVFHVALTRGRERVVVFADRDRPSRFLAEMAEPAKDEPAPSPRVARPMERGVAIGDVVRVAGGHDGTVVEMDGDLVAVRLATGARLKVWRSEVTTTTPAGPDVDADPDLVAQLKAWRLDTSREQGVPAYVVFGDATLLEIAARRPATLLELSTVKGIGPAKLDAYGDDILAMVE